jgi:Lar family restriction alleviation protein
MPTPDQIARFIQRGMAAQKAADEAIPKTTLAPCPFCGSSQVEAVSRARGEMWFVACLDCHAIGPEPPAGHQGDPTTEAEAIAAWNRRPAHP